MSDSEYLLNMRSDKTYISKRMDDFDDKSRRIRIANKVFASDEMHSFAVENGEHVIRITDGGKQAVTAKFYEDSRGIFTLTLQRFTVKSGMWHPSTPLSMVGQEIPKFLEFVRNIQLVDLPDEKRINITDAELARKVLSRQQVAELIRHNEDAVIELAKSTVTKTDIVALAYRREQLEKFRSLLDADHFQTEKTNGGFAKDEDVWQAFFEKNPWIFGYGLTQVMLDKFDEGALERVVSGFDLTKEGKRADAVLKTRSAVSSLCFVEIKTATTPLLKKTEYRPGCWNVSSEVSGGVAQTQATVNAAVRSLQTKIDGRDKQSDPTGEQAFLYQPKAFLLVGNLDEFKAEHGVNEKRFRSFELFRQNIITPEIITFDELLGRAQFIVENA